MKNTVFKLGMSRSNQNKVVITINDAHSGDFILDAKMSLEDAAKFLTGTHGVSADGRFNDKGNIAKEREVKTVSCARIDGYNKDLQRDLVEKDFNTYWREEGWLLHNDGTSSQQRGDKHNYVIKKYTTVQNPEVYENKF